ncbi:MAG: hypothetical protein D6755_07350 [Anaerolineae bacterium]|nr:MAG: hypothetical protein D6755_07350 [Anaerolineae bacterium]
MWGGLMVAFQGLKATPFGETPLYRLLNNLMGWILLMLLAIPFNWVAFGPGERHFTGGVSLPFISFGSRPSETSGRILFGCVAGGMDLVLLWMLLLGIYRALWRDGDR